MRRKHPYKVVLCMLACFAAVPLAAQTTIGGGTCNSSSLNGSYSFTITGRQVTGSAITNYFQANGFANFDGQSQISITMTSDTLQAFGVSLPWAGSYSIQANCQGTVTIATGGAGTFNLVVYNQGNGFLMTGADGTLSYSGSGNLQPASCLTNLLSGVYTMNATGYGVTPTALNAVSDATGLFQFDGQGNATANITLAAPGAALATLSLTGTYSVGSNCLGTATLSDNKGNTYSLVISVTGSSKIATNTFSLLLTRTGSLMISGTGHATYGQPTASAAREPNAPPTRPALQAKAPRKGERA